MKLNFIKLNFIKLNFMKMNFMEMDFMKLNFMEMSCKLKGVKQLKCMIQWSLLYAYNSHFVHAFSLFRCIYTA